MGSWFDILLVGLLAGAVAFGFYQGLLRQAFLLLSMYIGVVLAAQYFGYLSGILLRIAPSSSSEVTDVIAFLVLMTAFTVVVTWL
ncbi:MAG TPA: CvpA family protein, partial [Chloroflexota bacterium]